MLTEMKDAPLAAMKSGGSYARFRNGDLAESVDLDRVDFDRCEWANVRMKKVNFKEASVTRCSFEDVYLPYASFTRCDLTGTSFENCDLRRARFKECKLWYVEFKNCEVDYDELMLNAPREVNLRRRFYHSLRLNALGRRENREASRLLIAEMAARCTEAHHILFAADEYFRTQFSPKDRLSALGRWLGFTLDRVVWGYGLRLSALFRAAFCLVLLFAVLIWLTDANYVATTGGEVEVASFWQSLYLSAASFTTLGGPEAANGLAKFYSVVQATFGTIFLGLLAAAAFRRIER